MFALPGVLRTSLGLHCCLGEEKKKKKKLQQQRVEVESAVSTRPASTVPLYLATPYVIVLTMARQVENSLSSLL